MHLYASGMDELTNVLVYDFCIRYIFSGWNETRSEANAKWETWREVIESKNWLSRTKLEYIECKFSKNRNTNEKVIRLDDQEMLKSKNY